MAGKPAATVGSNHTCPMCSGTIPHVGGPVILGSPNVFINGKPVARMGDMCTCVGPPDTIVQGNPTVLINGTPIACMGDMTAHGGIIVSGEANVIIGSSTPDTPKATIAKERIPFPKITIKDRVLSSVSGNGKKLKEAKENQEKTKKENKNHGYIENYELSL